MECSSGPGLFEPLPSGRKPRVTLPPPVETLVVSTLTSACPGQLCPEPADGIEGILFDERRLDLTFQLGRDIAIETKHALVNLLQEYQDVFAFATEEISGISPSIMEHRLNVDPAQKLVVQKKGIWDLIEPLWKQRRYKSY